ncbi:MAG: hypothetical protein N2316_12840 [Spirochaetes bacterium]|nr:hypothetical protein [Spirochaetota bacterium]
MRKVPSLASFYNALKFVLLCKYKPIKRTYRYTQIRVGNRYRDAYVYFPSGRYHQKEKGTIVVIHGMSARANDDPRIVAVCEAFAQCGYVVVSPKFSEIAEFYISTGTINNIAETLRAVAFDALLCRTRRILIFAPSFSAGMSLLAISRLAGEGFIDAMCSIGAYGSVDTVIEELLNRSDIDEYGRLIVLKNVIRYAQGFGEKSVYLLREAILDNGLNRCEANFISKLAVIPAPLRKRIQRLLTDVNFRRRIWNQILLRSRKVRNLIGRLSVVENISHIPSRVVLIHGKDDKVISSRESKAIFAKLQSLRVPSALCITPLLSHGDAQKSRAFLRHLFELVYAFAFFFG